MSFENTRHQPIGTLTEITEQGMDPAEVACCHRHLKDGSVRGCPVEESCRFNLKARGGFKSKGPKYIGYYKRLSRGEGGLKKEDFMRCFDFVATLQGPMESGQAAKMRGEDHLHIEVIAQEGEEIIVKRYKSNAPDGGNRSGNIKIDEETLTIPVPFFPRPGDNPEVEYNQIIEARSKRRETASERAEGDQSERIHQATHGNGADLVVETEDIDTTDAPDLSEPETVAASIPLAEPLRPRIGKGSRG